MLEFKNEKERIFELNSRIEDRYGHIEEEEVEALAAECDASETRLIEVIEPKSRTVTVYDFLNDTTYPNMVFPGELQDLLRPEDVFLATFGMRFGQWHVLSLSPTYDSEATLDDCDCASCVEARSQIDILRDEMTYH